MGFQRACDDNVGLATQQGEGLKTNVAKRLVLISELLKVPPHDLAVVALPGADRFAAFAWSARSPEVAFIPELFITGA